MAKSVSRVLRRKVFLIRLYIVLLSLILVLAETVVCFIKSEFHNCCSPLLFSCLCGFIETFSGRSFSLDELRIPQEFSGCNSLGALSFIRALSRDYV